MLQLLTDNSYSLPIQAEPVKKLHLKNHEEIQRQIETKSLLELREINPFDHAVHEHN